MRIIAALALVFLPLSFTASAQDSSKVTSLKAEVSKMVDDRSKLSQEIIDSLFSFSELGFQ